MWPNPQETADLVTFTEEILNGKHHFFCAVYIASYARFSRSLNYKLKKRWPILKTYGKLYNAMYNTVPQN